MPIFDETNASEYSTHSPTCVNLGTARLTPSCGRRATRPSINHTFTLPLVCQIPLPMLECHLLFGGYPSCRGVAARGHAPPRGQPITRRVWAIYVLAPSKTARIFLERSLNALRPGKVSPSRCSPARLPCRLLGSLGCKQPSAPASCRRFAAEFCRAAHHAQECIRILWHRLEQPVNPAWYVGSTANAANTSSASW